MSDICLISLGCPKNLVDSETMLGALAQAGFSIVSEPEQAQAVIINTCGFIESAKKEAIDQILAAIALKEAGTIRAIVVTGCMSQRYQDEIAAAFPEVDAFLGTTSECHIVDALKAALTGKPCCAFDGENDPPYFGPRLQSTPPYTAYLKIAEGCNNRCTYCAIPLIRGPLRSIEQEPLLEQARSLAENGVKELIVVAQDTTAYGVDRGRRELPEFLEKLCDIEGLKWIRMLYCYPDKIDDALLQTMKKHDKILRYLDIPIQHADGGVLRAMHRPGDYDSLMALIEKIRTVLPDVVLRTTLIVGFPGETQEQFETLCRFVKAARFDKLGAFAYSPEEGTPAAEMEDQIDEDEKARRLDIIMQLQANISAENLEKKIGTVLDVLVEEYDEESECFVGRSFGDAPDIDGKVFFHTHHADQGDILPVRITAALDYDLIGEIEE